MRLLAESPWAFGWTAVAGLATALLAVVTWWLARSTRELARETEQDVSALWRPILVLAEPQRARVTICPPGSGRPYYLAVDLEVRNVGQGPALNTNAGDLDGKPRTWGTISNTIPVDHSGQARIYGHRDVLGDRGESSFLRSMKVEYSDIAGHTHQTVFRLKLDRDTEESTPDGTVYEAMLEVVLVFPPPKVRMTRKERLQWTVPQSTGSRL